MCTFGEIIEPVSRTAWEDWDEVIPEHNHSELKWQKEIDFPSVIDTFLLVEGKYLTDCIKMQSHVHQLELINVIPEANLQLYKVLGSNRYVCVIKDYNMILSSEIVELLKKYLLVSNDVITLVTKPLSEYQAAESALDCIIRKVSTSKTPIRSMDLNFPKLEQPNIISGVCAGVISLREHLNLSGTAIVCYTEYPEEFQVEEVQSLLEKLNIVQMNKSRPSSILNSNLYI